MKNDVYSRLVDWIHNHGGHVHESLELSGEGPSRGILCKTPIGKGELLIRLPASLALSGEEFPEYFGEGKRASPWLRCLAALYQEECKATPYIDSLPKEFETLFQWTDTQVAQYLGGTTLGCQLQTDRKHKTLETRYATAVRPYLEHLSIVQQEQQDDANWGRLHG